MPPEARTRLFEKFSSERERAGSHAGLGLYLCRLVAEAHGGTITLEDGQGWPVSFVVRLPAAGGHGTRDGQG